MSTRSLIGIKNDDRVKYIYCHNDGYLEGVGKTLTTYYKDKETVEKLLALGDISALGDKPEDLGESAWDALSPAHYADGCRTYISRGEDDTEAKECLLSDYESVGTARSVDFLYLFDPHTSKWSYNDFTSGDYETLDSDIRESLEEQLVDESADESATRVSELPEAKKAQLLKRLCIDEQLNETIAKPDGDKVACFNKALELAKKLNKPVVYGYTTRKVPGKFYEVEAKEYDGEDIAFRKQYGANVIYITYPDDDFIDTSDTTLREDFMDDALFKDTKDLLNIIVSDNDSSFQESLIDDKKKRALEKYNKYKTWNTNAKKQVCVECNIDENQLNEWLGE